MLHPPLGVGASLLAALEPALEAARVEPVDALRPSELVPTSAGSMS